MPTTPKRAAKTTIKKVEEQAPGFTVTLTIAGQTWTGQGVDLVEALTNLPKPEKMMLRGDVTITDGTRSNTLSFYPKDLKRLFVNKNHLNVRVKSLMMGLK